MYVTDSFGGSWREDSKTHGLQSRPDGTAQLDPISPAQPILELVAFLDKSMIHWPNRSCFQDMHHWVVAGEFLFDACFHQTGVWANKV
jgi:hypothetical protein